MPHHRERERGEGVLRDMIMTFSCDVSTAIDMMGRGLVAACHMCPQGLAFLLLLAK